MRVVDCGCYLANVFGGFAFGFDGVDVDVSPVTEGEISFGFVQVVDLRFQECVDGAAGVHRRLSVELEYGN